MKRTQNFNEPQIKDKFVSEITEATEATRKKSFLEKNEKWKNRIIFIHLHRLTYGIMNRLK